MLSFGGLFCFLDYFFLTLVADRDDGDGRDLGTGLEGDLEIRLEDAEVALELEIDRRVVGDLPDNRERELGVRDEREMTFLSEERIL